MLVLVVLPTFNERGNLGRLVHEVLADPDYRALVVDDRSPDGTGTVAEELAREYPGRVDCLHRDGPRGLGRAYIEGFSRALSTPADLICQMDADLSHSPSDLRRLVGAAGNHDLVIGSRYLGRGPQAALTPGRRLLSRGANAYVRGVLRLVPRDCTSGFRCWRREALAGMALHRIISRGYSFQVEMLHNAARLGCRIAEIPIAFGRRADGASKLSAGVIAESALLPWRLRWQTLRFNGSRSERSGALRH